MAVTVFKLGIRQKGIFLCSKESMTKFAISFVLGFRKDICEGHTKRKKRKKNYESLNLPKHYIVCGDLTHFVHIDYSFVPRKVSNSLDILFYENMAILYTNSDPQAQRTVRRGRLHWCCFTITHDVDLTDKDIIKLHDNNITMKVYNSRYRVAEKLLRLQPGIYAHEREEAIKKLFCPLYKVNNIPRVSQQKQSQQPFVWNKLIQQSLSQLSLNEFEKEAGLNHRNRAEHLINYLVQHSNINAFISRPPFGLKMQSISSGNDTPRHIRGRLSPPDSNEPNLELIKSDFSFPGEMIFTDRKELLFDMNSNKNLRGFILITVNNLLTPEQCNRFNPFLISITTIENVPVPILKEKGFDRVYVQYETALFGNIRTNTYPLKKIINIQESRSFLTHINDKLELLNFAQSGYIIFKIRGIRREQSGDAVEGALFGSLDVDFKLNKPFTKSTQNLYSDLLKNKENHRIAEDRLLFVAEYTYANLLNLGWISATSISCTTMRNIFNKFNYQSTLHKRQYLNTIDINYSNENTIADEENCFLDTKTLIESQTVLNLTMSIASAMSKTLLSILSTNEPLSRIGLIIYDINVILDLLTVIYEYNTNLRQDMKDTNTNCTELRFIRNESFDKSFQQFITGFYIDNGKTFYLFVEGSAAGFIHVIWNKIMHLSKKVALVWYNSDLVFTKRLYSGMLPSTSIYGIVLKEPIENLFRKSYTFLKGSMPIPCWEAVRKLNFLLMESTMILTSTRGLFPTMEELISFDIEFGIPNKIFDPNVYSPTSTMLIS